MFRSTILSQDKYFNIREEKESEREREREREAMEKEEVKFFRLGGKIRAFWLPRIRYRSSLLSLDLSRSNNSGTEDCLHSASQERVDHFVKDRGFRRSISTCQVCVCVLLPSREKANFH